MTRAERRHLAGRSFGNRDEIIPRIEDWNTPPEVAPPTFAEIRRRMMLEACKWDPQVGDGSTLAPFPIVLPAEVAEDLARLAERLAAEALAAERVLIESPDLLARLGLPRAVRRALSAPADPTPAAARVVRFDFHPTPDGWRISEANADVPGGYCESSLFPRLMAGHFPGTRPAGDPAAALADAILVAIGRPGTVGLLSASGYMEDHQVVAFLARVLTGRGCDAVRTDPRQIAWRDRRASLAGPDGSPLALDAIVRFYQGEWLAGTSTRQGWPAFFRGGRTPVCNPGTAMTIESKRFPLTWDRLGLDLPTWRTLVPETIDPRRLGRRPGPGWVLKAACGNTGDTVAFSDDADGPRWRRAARAARLRPSRWVAQRRFETLAIPTPRGPRYPCLGVYTVDGRAAGIFGRLGRGPLIDFAATEAAVLVKVEPGINDVS